MDMLLFRTAQRCLGLYTSLIFLAFSALPALAQTYTYQTIDPPFAFDGAIAVTAITDLGKLAGTYAGSDIGPWGSWTRINAAAGYKKLSFKNKAIFVNDMNASARTVGIYYTMNGIFPTGLPAKAFTINSGTLTTLKLPPLTSVDHCTVNDAHDIVCTGRTADDVIQAVRVKGSTAGVLQVYTSGISIFGINGARDVVGTQLDPTTSTYRGYYRHAATGQEVLIDAPCGLDTVIMDVNLASTLAAVQCGDWEGGGFDGYPHSYALNGGTWTELTVPGSPVTVVQRLNNAGQFVGMHVDSEQMINWGSHGFIATPVFGQPIAQR